MENAIIQSLELSHTLKMGERTAERILELIRESGPDDQLIIKERDSMSGTPKTITMSAKKLRLAMANGE